MRNIPERLLDIQDAIARIMKYTQNGRYRYDHDELVQTWVTHNLYVIGEATRAIASDFPDFKDQHPEILWRQITGMRNVLVHIYFGINRDRVWAVVEHDLPNLKTSIDALLNTGETSQ